MMIMKKVYTTYIITSFYITLSVLLGLPIRTMDLLPSTETESSSALGNLNAALLKNLATNNDTPTSRSISQESKSTKKKKRRRKKKKLSPGSSAKKAVEEPIIYTYETSPQKEIDGSFVRQETKDFIEIVDPKKEVELRIYKIAPIAQARPDRSKFLPFTINAQDEALKNQLSLIHKKMKPAKRVSEWFSNPMSALTEREHNTWNTIYDQQSQLVINPEIAADKELQRLFSIKEEQIGKQKRELTDKEKWTIYAHNFTPLVDQFIPEYAVYSTKAIPKGQLSFLIPGELNIPDSFNESTPVVFEYTIAPNILRNGEVIYSLYHRFASQAPRDMRVQHLLTEVWNKLHPYRQF
jgi:hypothetical protein